MGYETPVLRPILMHIVNKGAIFLFSPRALNHLRIKYLLPTMKTLNISPVFEPLSDSLPVFGPHLLDELLQQSDLTQAQLGTERGAAHGGCERPLHAQTVVFPRVHGRRPRGAECEHVAL